ncbi:carboxymuconolactone decarboxylase family protein [Streptomonospora nanhaiensis]|uniref:AhpD family alkylhydroperoxidase n=1 Tax=Streptomonospora nanhaiensis TaxID=1323731 RepID=A0A853BIH0_9ACTN|nr:carboxymuconolactone decarboxylase family protein [Streptomonospora nanhaiensis]MBV2362933.1 carboxymuconolactone decarboxylase family protein [Streptomonospora nanhaiensis]MBX9388937.1 carboxymuconolactone decarboxylase family protein [Streptomonospora nanhaiensis]NYI95298.1 AhpD family alkylhydroperoxidase [Streptomonospora nanhaiensis]
MSQRMNVIKLAPDAYKAVSGLEAWLRASTLPTGTLELVKIRVSQINGCAFCVDMHTHDARKEGESEERLLALPVWWESPLFTDAERAALALAEEATRLSDRRDAVSDPVWEEAARHYDEETLAALVLAVAAINFWNRVAVTTRMVPGSHRPSAS